MKQVGAPEGNNMRIILILALALCSLIYVNTVVSVANTIGDHYRKVTAMDYEDSNPDYRDSEADNIRQEVMNYWNRKHQLMQLFPEVDCTSGKITRKEALNCGMTIL